MNPVQDKIRDHLDSFPPELAPLSDAARRYLRYCSAIDIDDTIMIAHQPWDGPLGYTFRLFPGAKKSWFVKYGKLHDIRIPTMIRSLLASVNGCEAFGISIYGMPPSMLRNPPLLDRSTAQCLDLATANQDWKHEFQGVADEAFHFGARYYTDEENTGYFLLGKTIVSMLNDGQVLGQWNDMKSFLADELRESEKRECLEIPSEWWH
jgi:hypothetical protein